MKWALGSITLLVIQAAGWAQSAQVITFDRLLATKVDRKLAWINPDSSREEMEITELSIPVDKQMTDLSRKFQRENYNRTSIWVEPKMIVIHSMDLGDLRSSLEQSSFLDRRMPSRWRTQIKAGTLPSGAHFIIDRDGKIYCLTPPMSRSDSSHVSYQRDDHHWFIRRHFDAIPVALGIENVTSKNRNYDDLTEEQVAANAQLVRWMLWMEQGGITHVASHHQFNDREQYVSMLKEFSLELARPVYRAWTRRDVGEVVLKRILNAVDERGWRVNDRF